jgi:hypothetical protein
MSLARIYEAGTMVYLNPDRVRIVVVDLACICRTPGYRLFHRSSSKPMKFASVALFIILAWPSLVIGQPSNNSSSRATLNSAANRAWPAFFSRFRSAIHKRDRKALRQMLSPDLHYSSGHHPTNNLDEAFKYWDESDGWRGFDRILSQGTVPLGRWWNNGSLPERPSRVAPAAANRRINIDRERIHWYAIFEFHEDGRWYCNIFKLCCD